MKTQQPRAQALREQRLASNREQVDNGSLVIRERTPEERASYQREAEAPARR